MSWNGVEWGGGWMIDPPHLSFPHPFPALFQEDIVGHSSFMAGVIASDSECPGFAPDVSLYMMRVFDSTVRSSE